MELNHTADNFTAIQPVSSAGALPYSPDQDSLATPADYAYCRQVMRLASKNYSFASRFLPPEKLPHVEALYALMRVGDDRVDVSHEGFATPYAAIENWEHAYWHAMETGSSPDPVMRAYLDTSLKFGIPKGILAPYFRAMKDDLTVTRFSTFADLVHYMEGSALTVGRAMTYILGALPPYKIEDALPGADSLATAMQLSNFWRDIGQDWGIGRVYLPQEDLGRFNVTEADLAARRITPQFIELLEFQFERTERYYEHARKYIKLLASGQWGVLSALEIYRAIPAGIRRNHYDVFNRRAGASGLRKAGLVLKSYLQVRQG
jgi:phytoene synthase